jgi:hypothetical protein
MIRYGNMIIKVDNHDGRSRTLFPTIYIKNSKTIAIRRNSYIASMGLINKKFNHRWSVASLFYITVYLQPYQIIYLFNAIPP